MSRIINNKRITTINGQEILDIVEQQFKYTQDVQVESATPIKKDEQMRPDLVSFRIFRSIDDYDIILKYNGISNPFSLSTDDILLIPNLEQFNENLNDDTVKINKEEFRNRYLDATKKPESRSQQRSNFDNANRNSSTPNAPAQTPVNFADLGSEDIQIEGGLITFGVSNQPDKELCNNPIAKSQLLDKLCKKK